jgi:hypothetical protein
VHHFHETPPSRPTGSDPQGEKPTSDSIGTIATRGHAHKAHPCHQSGTEVIGKVAWVTTCEEYEGLFRRRFASGHEFSHRERTAQDSYQGTHPASLDSYQSTHACHAVWIRNQGTHSCRAFKIRIRARIHGARSRFIRARIHGVHSRFVSGHVFMACGQDSYQGTHSWRAFKIDQDTHSWRAFKIRIRAAFMPCGQDSYQGTHSCVP